MMKKMIHSCSFFYLCMYLLGLIHSFISDFRFWGRQKYSSFLFAMVPRFTHSLKIPSSITVAEFCCRHTEMVLLDTRTRKQPYRFDRKIDRYCSSLCRKDMWNV